MSKGAIDVGSEIAEVILADAEFEDLIDDGDEVMERPNGL